MQSEQIDQLAAALVKAQAEFSAVPKDSVNPFFKSKYAALPEVKATAGPVLSRHGLAVSQFIGAEDTLVTYLLHESGQFIAHSMNLHLVKDDPQGQGSAVTYARRYSYMSCLGLVADEDDDGNRGSNPQNQGQSRPQARTAPAQAKPEASEDIDLILQAAQMVDDEFLNSLAKQYLEKGRLSEKQIASGVAKAAKVITTPRSAPAPQSDEVPWGDEEVF